MGPGRISNRYGWASEGTGMASKGAGRASETWRALERAGGNWEKRGWREKKKDKNDRVMW